MAEGCQPLTTFALNFRVALTRLEEDQKDRSILHHAVRTNALSDWNRMWDSDVGEEFASQLLCDKAVVAAGGFLLDYKKHIHDKERLASPATLKLPAQTTSPKKCATRNTCTSTTSTFVYW